MSIQVSLITEFKLDIVRSKGQELFQVYCRKTYC